MVSTVSRKKKDAKRVSYNLSTQLREEIIKYADTQGWYEVDALENLVVRGLVLSVMLRKGELSYDRFQELRNQVTASESMES